MCIWPQRWRHSPDRNTNSTKASSCTPLDTQTQSPHACRSVYKHVQIHVHTRCAEASSAPPHARLLSQHVSSCGHPQAPTFAVPPSPPSQRRTEVLLHSRERVGAVRGRKRPAPRHLRDRRQTELCAGRGTGVWPAAAADERQNGPESGVRQFLARLGTARHGMTRHSGRRGTRGSQIPITAHLPLGPFPRPGTVM